MAHFEHISSKARYTSALFHLAAFAGLASLLAGGGCNLNEKGLVDVSGVVTLDGEPVTTGEIVFFPETGRPARGDIDAEGRYLLTSYEPGDGAKPGQYVVTITSQEASVDGSIPTYNSIEDEMAGNVASPTSRSASQRSKWLVPRRYANRATTDLTAEVTGDSDINFQLKSKP